VVSSGWHLHQCLLDAGTGANRFATGAGERSRLSGLARHYLGGLLAHARAASVFTTLTINGYKRYRPHSLAPDRLLWVEDNKGALIRAVGVAGDPADDAADRLPASLMEAVAALRADPVFAQRLGPEFVDYLIELKESEIERFLTAVTDWEQRGYFTLY
jgi:glutamine synthetase